MHVDGFRFDLGTILAREPNGFDNQSGFPQGSRTGSGVAERQADRRAVGHRAGRLSGRLVPPPPPGWAEWTDKFRDDVRDFWRGRAGVGTLASRLCASAESFNHQGRRAWACVNFVTAHDGFTLNDVVTYDEKHNEDNGEDNKDGNSDNRSWNCGTEGPTDDDGINELRSRQIRNMLATLLLSQGTPMLLAGDEFGRTQGGNNNAYCQDSEISWLDWDIKEKGHSLIAFTQRLTALRHKHAILRHSRFLSGDWNDEGGFKDLTWISTSGHEMGAGDWGDPNTRCFGMLIDGRAQATGIKRQGADATMLLVFNGWRDGVGFTLPAEPSGTGWSVLIDTNQPDLVEEPRFKAGDMYEVTGRSVLLLLMTRD